MNEADLLALYRWMLSVRLFDERMVNLQRQGRIGFYGPITGQEAATVGSGYALEPGDWIFPALREGAIARMKGLPLAAMVAQLMGNSADRCKGRQMPCHYSFREGGYVSMSSCIATQLPQAVGWAMAAKIRKEPRVAVAYLGDGATSESDFHTAANFAGVYKAPVVFFCQNNQWAITVPFSKQTASAGVAVKAKAYGFPGVQVDGNDVVAVHAATREALTHARSGQGPTLIEAVTYRMGGHTTSDDPSRYRDEAEVAAWRAKDPILRFRRTLEARGLWNEAAEERAREEIKEEINQAIAKNEPLGPPASNTLFEDVYV